jgi:hypothetical protein
MTLPHFAEPVSQSRYQRGSGSKAMHRKLGSMIEIWLSTCPTQFSFGENPSSSGVRFNAIYGQNADEDRQQCSA